MFTVSVEKIGKRLLNYMTNLYRWILSCLNKVQRIADHVYPKQFQDLLSTMILSYNIERIENLKLKAYQHNQRKKEVVHANANNLLVEYQMAVNPFGELLNYVDGKAYFVDGVIADYYCYFEEMSIELLFTFEY